MNSITYIGHATLRVQLGDVRLLTDPLLTARVAHLRRTTVEPQVNGPELDAILISHLHVDHLHLPSLRRLGRGRRLIVPRGAAAFLARLGFHHVDELSPGDTVTLKGVTIEATPAHHPGRDMPGRPHTRALGYVIHGRRRVYFAGDTDLFHGMANIGLTAAGRHLDVALLPVWGWGPWLGVGHLDPHEAARALELLRPSLAIPIHWGTYFPLGLRRLLPAVLHRPPRAFAHFAAHLAPQVRVAVLDPGETLELGDEG